MGFPLTDSIQPKNRHHNRSSSRGGCSLRGTRCRCARRCCSWWWVKRTAGLQNEVPHRNSPFKAREYGNQRLEHCYSRCCCGVTLLGHLCRVVSSYLLRPLTVERLKVQRQVLRETHYRLLNTRQTMKTSSSRLPTQLHRCTIHNSHSDSKLYVVVLLQLWFLLLLSELLPPRSSNIDIVQSAQRFSPKFMLRTIW